MWADFPTSYHLQLSSCILIDTPHPQLLHQTPVISSLFHLTLPEAFWGAAVSPLSMTAFLSLLYPIPSSLLWSVSKPSMSFPRSCYNPLLTLTWDQGSRSDILDLMYSLRQVSPEEPPPLPQRDLSIEALRLVEYIDERTVCKKGWSLRIRKNQTFFHAVLVILR